MQPLMCAEIFGSDIARFKDDEIELNYLNVSMKIEVHEDTKTNERVQKLFEKFVDEINNELGVNLETLEKEMKKH